jgi:hypothetical protein
VFPPSQPFPAKLLYEIFSFVELEKDGENQLA